MALSFKESAERIKKEKSTARNISLFVNDGDATLRSETKYIDGYDIYTEYKDTSENVINLNRKISVSSNQTILTQDSNSQYLYFKMFRMYDGIDQTTKQLKFHAVTPEGYDIYITPVNVTYDNDYIYFGVIVNDELCAKEGVVQFEIQSIGKNEKQGNYKLITRAASINVEKSLSGNGDFQPSPVTLDELNKKIDSKADGLKVVNDTDIILTSNGQEIGTSIATPVTNPPVIDEKTLDGLFK